MSRQPPPPPTAVSASGTTSPVPPPLPVPGHLPRPSISTGPHYVVVVPQPDPLLNSSNSSSGSNTPAGKHKKQIKAPHHTLNYQRALPPPLPPSHPGAHHAHSISRTHPLPLPRAPSASVAVGKHPPPLPTSFSFSHKHTSSNSSSNNSTATTVANTRTPSASVAPPPVPHSYRHPSWSGNTQPTQQQTRIPPPISVTDTYSGGNTPMSTTPTSTLGGRCSECACSAFNPINHSSTQCQSCSHTRATHFTRGDTYEDENSSDDDDAQDLRRNSASLVGVSSTNSRSPPPIPFPSSPPAANARPPPPQPPTRPSSLAITQHLMGSPSKPAHPPPQPPHTQAQSAHASGHVPMPMHGMYISPTNKARPPPGPPPSSINSTAGYAGGHIVSTTSSDSHPHPPPVPAYSSHHAQLISPSSSPTSPGASFSPPPPRLRTDSGNANNHENGISPSVSLGESNRVHHNTVYGVTPHSPPSLLAHSTPYTHNATSPPETPRVVLHMGTNGETLPTPMHRPMMPPSSSSRGSPAQPTIPPPIPNRRGSAQLNTYGSGASTGSGSGGSNATSPMSPGAAGGGANSAASPQSQQTKEQSQWVDPNWTPSFASRLHHKFDVVVDQSNSGMRLLKRVRAFMTRFSSLQERYAAELAKITAVERNKLLSMPKPDQMRTCHNATLGFFDSMTELSSANLQFSQELKEVTVEQLEKWYSIGTMMVREQKSEQERVHQAMMRVNLNVTKERELANQALQKLATKRQGADNDSTSSSSSSASSSTFSFLKSSSTPSQKSFEKSRESAIKTCESYQTTLIQANTQHARYNNEELPQMLTQMQSLEEMRLHSLNSALRDFTRLHQSFTTSMQNISNVISTLSDQMNGNNDIQEFVQKTIDIHGPALPPVPFTFDLPLSLNELRAMTYDEQPSSLFYSTIEGVMKHQLKTTTSATTNTSISTIRQLSAQYEVPLIVSTLLKNIIDNDGQFAEGIFRISVGSEELTRLRRQLEQGDFNINNSTSMNNNIGSTPSPHISACLLKSWFRDLLTPIVPYSLYGPAIALGQVNLDGSSSVATPQEIAQVKAVLSDLPPVNEKILCILFSFLKKLSIESKYVVKTRMNAPNFALVFSPGLVRSEKNDPMQMLQDTRYASNFVQRCIECTPDCFSNDARECSERMMKEIFSGER